MRIVLAADKPAVLNVKMPKQLPVKGLRDKSVTVVKDTLEFALKTNAKGLTIRVKVALMYKDRVAGELVLLLGCAVQSAKR